jgi:5-methyltetrahydropteroyltriglutamate--homocysteine methyltransferase
MSVIRSDQVGSLIRPVRLHDARDAFHAGRIDLTALRQAEDEAILEALAWQKDVGIDVFTDGEMRRDAWQTNIMQAVDGFEPDYPTREVPLADGSTAALETHNKVVLRKLHQVQRLVGTDAEFLTRHAPGPFKITMPSPSRIARVAYRPDVTQDYDRVSDLEDDLAAIIRGEMQALAAENVWYIQLDEGFTNFDSEAQIQKMREQDLDPVRELAAQIALENSCYDAVRMPGMTLAAHVCRGSRLNADKNLLMPVRTSHDFDFLAEHLFSSLHVDRFLFEFDSDFAALRHLPKDKVMVLGIVSSVSGTLENRDDILRCVEAALKYCSLDQLALSTQCGFSGSGTRDGAHMSIDQQRRKLELVATTAREIWR